MFALLALVAAYLPAAEVPPPAWVPEILEQWEDLTQPTVITAKCGGLNGFYYPGEHTIVLCRETFQYPQLARWIFHHEMAHAFMAQHNVLPGHYEFAADELGTLMASTDETLAAALWFSRMGPGPKNDTHPAPLERGRAILCLERGFVETEGVCRSYFISARDNWLRIFAAVLG